MRLWNFLIFLGIRAFSIANYFEFPTSYILARHLLINRLNNYWGNLMFKKMIFVVAVLFLAVPYTAFALEQSFTQNGLKAIIRLTPDEPAAGQMVNLALRIENEGRILTDRQVTLEIYEKETTEPLIKRAVDLLDDEYVDSWSFEKEGEYKVVVSISDPGKPGEALHYEVRAAVGAARNTGHNGHEDHGFFSHHFGGGKWGWWGAGLMLLIMVPMMVIGL